MQETMFVAQGFRKEGRRRRLVADQPQRFKSASEAIRAAESLGNRRVGAVAYSIKIDHETDFADEPEVLFRTGELPPELSGE